MINRINVFANNATESTKIAEVIKDKLIDNGFTIASDDYELAIAVGGDGTFLNMVKENNFNSALYYVGINSGTLGFMQEVKVDEIDEFITQLKSNKYKVEKIGIQETTINHSKGTSRYFSLNEIIIRDKDLKVAKLEINVDNNLLEDFIGDGVLIATSSGSTAHNLSYGGSIVYNTFTSLQITPMGAINSKVYKSLINSVIIPDKKEIVLIPKPGYNNLLVTIDGENKVYDNVQSIQTKIDDKKINFLRLSHYNFPQKINEKLLASSK